MLRRTPRRVQHRHPRGPALAAHHGLDLAAEIEIRKGIPVAGGLAGGSADAAATLVALDRLWDLRTDDDDLLAIAAELGSDVPFALIGGTAHGVGRGELVDLGARPRLLLVGGRAQRRGALHPRGLPRVRPAPPGRRRQAPTSGTRVA